MLQVMPLGALNLDMPLTMRNQEIAGGVEIFVEVISIQLRQTSETSKLPQGVRDVFGPTHIPALLRPRALEEAADCEQLHIHGPTSRNLPRSRTRSRTQSRMEFRPKGGPRRLPERTNTYCFSPAGGSAS